jgi:uncharacterized membrane protein
VKAAAWTLTALHGLALVLGLFGILVAIPHPELWSGARGAAAVYAFMLGKAGATAMVLGALAMLAYGFWTLGARRTLLFFCAATIISASAELTGTKTGWPFGGYEYTDLLGPKLLGRVPFAIPVSWFTMGFASFVLADALAVRARWRRRTVWSIVLGAWLLTAWDLVLDPSMAAPQMRYVHFWIWHETGPYFGMPLRNLAGWFGTGLLFIAVGRTLWNERTAPSAPVALPLVVYALNVVWSMLLSFAAGMWLAALVAIVLMVAPAAIALRRNSADYPPVGMLGPRAIAWWALRTMTESVRVEGLEHVPADGPVVIAARHVHNLLDGAVLIARLRRPLHVVVALDWTTGPFQRRWMERACAAARWPVILRPQSAGGHGGFAAHETGRYLRSGLHDAAELLRDGRVLAVFPEGYPLMDPAANGRTPPRDADGFLPFASGFRRIAELGECRGARHVAIVPVGFSYERRGRRWRITARFGPPFETGAPVEAVERAVRDLSRSGGR